ncbi:MAG: hypothetical protein J6U20_01525 [Fibrobacter sp.]|nr:hypothetical protein [Fibrobacter sp.]
MGKKAAARLPSFELFFAQCFCLFGFRLQSAWWIFGLGAYKNEQNAQFIRPNGQKNILLRAFLRHGAYKTVEKASFIRPVDLKTPHLDYIQRVKGRIKTSKMPNLYAPTGKKTCCRKLF